MDWLKARAVEPSTYEGAAYVLAAIGLIPVAAVPAVVSVAAAIIGLVKVIKKEK